MSFFGFEQQDIEAEKRKFLEQTSRGVQPEDVAVYTWGEDSYDGLGDALQEAGDDQNDETFGVADVGKDFDFSSTSKLQGDSAFSREPSAGHSQQDAQSAQAQYQQQERQSPQVPQSNNASRPAHSLEAIWDDKSPFSVLPRATGRPTEYQPNYHNMKPQGQASGLNHGVHDMTSARTLDEIEAEMFVATQAARQRAISPSQALSQLHLRAQIARDSTSTPQHVATPPPRLHPHSQSPRFHQQQQQHQIQLLQLQQQQQQQQQQRQLLELQEQRERRQQQQLLELQEQLRFEEIERQHQRRIQMQLLQRQQGHLAHQGSVERMSPSLAEHQLRRLGQRSPAVMNTQSQIEAAFPPNGEYIPNEIQQQQRILAEMAQQEFLNSMQGSTMRTDRDVRQEQEMQELLQAEAVRKIMEAERMEEKRRRRLAKIAHMSRYNDLMTQSDKDFITRIQVSQLVTQDPYADDFYAQVYGAILRSRQGLQSQDERVLKFGSGGGVGLGLAQSQRGGARRPSAMQRMEQQVERIVNNARLREKERFSLNSLQGALGKTSGRSYKAAPRQLLQVDPGNPGSSPTLSHATVHISRTDVDREDAAKEAAKQGREALGTVNMAGFVHKDPLTRRETLVILERLYDAVLDVEQHGRDQPPPEDEEAAEAWEKTFREMVKELWDGLQVMVPLETSDPHPFISLLTPTKGKRLLPRITRHLGNQQMLTLLTLLVACFPQLDVVRQAPLLDLTEETPEQKEVDNQTQAFLTSVMQSILPVVAKASLRLISGLLGLLLERSDVVAVARTKPGIALLTLFLSRVELIKHDMATATEVIELPTAEETEQWQLMFDHLFQFLAPHLVSLFPSVRIAVASRTSASTIATSGALDQHVWQFLAPLALLASLEQQQVLVTTLRERVLENVMSVKKGWVADKDESKLRMANVDLFLHSLGLDSSQITM